MISADLSGETALVTGAASGIGLATATLFARCGARIALNHLPDVLFLAAGAGYITGETLVADGGFA